MNANWSETDDKGWDATSDSSWSNGIRTNKVLLETPESPPMYEKSSFRDPVQYNDPQSQEPILSSATDVDHRVIPAPMPADVHPPHRLIKTADVDHRNLISLTGSPANNISNTNDAAPVTNNRLWSNADQDYRSVNYYFSISIVQNIIETDLKIKMFNNYLQKATSTWRYCRKRRHGNV